MKFTPNVDLRNVKPQMILALIVANEVWAEAGLNLTVRYGADGKHSATSLHYDGGAFDLRIWGLDEPQRIAETLQSRLPPDFDVVYETTHIHVEWQPKYRGN